jgi:hypothetical protein
VGRVEIPAKKWVSKSSSPVPKKIRGVLNNIPNILVKVRVSGVKFWFGPPLTPLLAGKSAIYNQASTTELFGVAMVCWAQLNNIIMINLLIICLPP